MIGGTSATPVFFGRYTDEETSNSNFLSRARSADSTEYRNANVSDGLRHGPGPRFDELHHVDARCESADRIPVVRRRSAARRGHPAHDVIRFDVKIWDNHYSEAAGNDVNRNGTIDPGRPSPTLDIRPPRAISCKARMPSRSTAHTSIRQARCPGAGPGRPPTRTPPTASFTTTTTCLIRGTDFNFDNLARTYDGDAADTSIFYAPHLPAPLWKAVAAQHRLHPGDQVDPINTANGYVYQCTSTGTNTSALTPPVGQQNPFHLDDVVNTPLSALDGGVQWTPKARRSTCRPFRSP